MKGCLTCKHAAFNQLKIIPDWKPVNEWDKFGRRDVRKLIRETNKHCAALCTLNPLWLDVTTNHYCGQWKKTRNIEADIAIFLWGDYVTQQRDDYAIKIDRLKTQLAHSRKLAASRLARLNATTSGGSADAG